MNNYQYSTHQHIRTYLACRRVQTPFPSPTTPLSSRSHLGLPQVRLPDQSLLVSPDLLKVPIIVVPQPRAVLLFGRVRQRCVLLHVSNGAGRDVGGPSRVRHWDQLQGHVPQALPIRQAVTSELNMMAFRCLQNCSEDLSPSAFGCFGSAFRGAPCTPSGRTPS